MEMNKKSYQKLIDENIEFAEKHLPDSLEKDHILLILEASVENEYGSFFPDINLLRELAVRTNVIFPESTAEIKWFEQGTERAGNFFQRLNIALGGHKKHTQRG